MKTDLHWEKIGFRPHHGIALPLFSLRTKNSCGIGEFNDLIPIIDWCATLNLDVIQLLPINDSGEDPSPYNAISSCALDPVYLSLADLPGRADISTFKVLDKLPRIARNEVKRLKLEWLYDYYLKNFIPETLFENFIKENAWLSAYADYKDDKRKEFHYFLQFLCFQQMKQVKEYATQKKIFLEGDIPILLSPRSVDVLSEPELFDLSLEAGAPPDQYSPTGQHWGFPLMNWEAMNRNGFQWWKRRLVIAEHCFHMYRIDHVVGLFRMWGIPKGDKPINGHYVPEDPTLWLAQGHKALEMMIEATSMLPIAEDLGIVPEEVRILLKQLGICGTKVLRWERLWGGNLDYILHEKYEPLSLTTVGTHDSEPLILWWKNHPDEAMPYAKSKNWTYEPDLSLSQRKEILKDSHHTASFFHINPLQEYLSLFPELSWPKPEDERINTPGTLLPENWTYRFYPNVEEIIAHEPLAILIKQLI